MIDRAIEILKRGGLVAFPTETVYGLGADATSDAAVRRIFQAKGRPATNPLICHVPNQIVARRYARDWPLAASRITDAFWPGPITIVVYKTPEITNAATAGGETVGLRAPNHPLALSLLRAFGTPIAAPSANRSTRISPTTALHVRDELGDDVDLILDGGPCRVGIESTVLDLTCTPPRILRPGGVTREQIEQVIGPVEMNAMPDPEGAPAGTPLETPLKAPGQLPIHYAPQTPAYRFEARDREKLDMTDAAVLEPTLDPESFARNLYARLRLLDSQDLRVIYVQMPPDTPAWAAVRDRLIRATKPLSELSD